MSRDNHLKHAVLLELRWEPSVDAVHIGVIATDGVITLSGHAENFAQRHAAEMAAQRVKGVKAIINQIGVRLPFGSVRADEEIAAAASHWIQWDVSIPRNSVRADVEQGWVILTGEVKHYYQKVAAEHDVLNLVGVVGVTNKIKVKPGVDAANISDDIMHALQRSWFFEPNAVNVTAEGSRVRLTGTVNSPHDRQIAASTAWSAPGVTDVENDLVVR